MVEAPRICGILGVDPYEPFEFRGMTFQVGYYSMRFLCDGFWYPYHNADVLLAMINYPEKIIRHGKEVKDDAD